MARWADRQIWESGQIPHLPDGLPVRRVCAARRRYTFAPRQHGRRIRVPVHPTRTLRKHESGTIPVGYDYVRRASRRRAPPDTRLGLVSDAVMERLSSLVPDQREAAVESCLSCSGPRHSPRAGRLADVHIERARVGIDVCQRQVACGTPYSRKTSINQLQGAPSFWSTTLMVLQVLLGSSAGHFANCRLPRAASMT